MFGMKKLYCTKCKKQWILETVDDFSKLDEVKVVGNPVNALVSSSVKLIHVPDDGPIHIKGLLRRQIKITVER